MFCVNDIDPRFDKGYCIDYMRQCVVNRGIEFDTCSDYYDADAAHWFIKQSKEK